MRIIRDRALTTVKTILSMESMCLLDCSQPLAMSRTLLFTVQVPDLMRQDGSHESGADYAPFPHGKARISETSLAGGCTTGCTIVPKQERSSPNKSRLSEHKSLIPNNKRWTRAIC